MKILPIFLVLFIVAACPTNPQQPPMIHTIMFFGDSLTEGPGIEKYERYPEVIQNYLKRDGFEWAVINAGISGETTQDGLNRLNSTLDANRVDVFFLCMGGNDFLKNQDMDQAEKNLDTIITTVKARGITPLIASVGIPFVGNVPSSFAYFVDRVARAKKLEAIYPKLAAKHNIAVVPGLLSSIPTAPIDFSFIKNLSGFSASALFDQGHMVDAIHPNAKGHQLIAATTYAALKPALIERQKNHPLN